MTATGRDSRVVAIVPARLASTRFPNKMIAPLAGRPLVVNTCQRALRAPSVGRVILAVDDARIAEAAKPFDVEVAMTRPDHPSGTDRIAEVAHSLDCDIVVNVQGDEACILPEVIEAAVTALNADEGAVASTVCRRITDPVDIANPNIVKVVRDQNGRALYFSRHPIPYDRDGDAAPAYFHHIGLYVYRRDFLLQYPDLPQTPLEQAEKLEQLRILEHGFRMAVAETEYESIGVDTPDDLVRAEAWLAAEARGPEHVSAAKGES